MIGVIGSVFSIAFALNGTLLASGFSDKTVKFWDATTGQCLVTFQGYNGSVISVALHRTVLC